MQTEAYATGDIGVGCPMHPHPFDLRFEEGERELGHTLAALAGMQSQRAHTAVECKAEGEAAAAGGMPPTYDSMH
jgi:hypothetical protein